MRGRDSAVPLPDLAGGTDSRPALSERLREATRARGATLADPSHAERLLDALPDGALLADESGAIVWANRTFIERFSFSFEELAGQPVSLVAGPYAQQQEGEKLMHLLRSGDGTVDTTAFNHDGVPFPCEVRLRTLVLDDGVPMRLLTITDQSEVQRLQAEVQLRAELALREREILRSTSELLDDSVLVIDDSERVVLVNSASTTMFELEGSVLIGRALSEMPLPPAVRGAWLAFLASGQPSAMQTSRLTIGGKPRPVLLQLLRLRASRGVPIASVLLARDLSVHARADREQGTFMAQVSHELRTPLASIRGFIETLLLEPDLPQDLRVEFCEIIQNEARRLGTLIEGLLDVAGHDEGRTPLKATDVELGAVVRETIGRLGEQGAAVDVDLPDEPVAARVDPVLVDRLVTQVVKNAAVHGASPRGVRLTLNATGPSIRISVRDWGRGLPPSEIERIFEPFYRVLPGPPAGSGPGLGLTECRLIAERHGGSMWAELPVDGGLRMVVELPRAEESRRVGAKP